MKVQYKKFLNGVSQAGSLMIEAMAMLALISLVTPTLYKKSAERTSELQDINTATNVRTIMKAVDSFVTANYQSLLEDQLQADGSVFEIDLSDGGVADGIHDYFPYGYKFDNLKNFGMPKIVLKRQGLSITSFVQLPKKTEIGEMRAARIASMIGSNGGYVNGDSDAVGVGGVWSLSGDELSDLGFDSNKGSVVVASSDAINTASSGALENEKYLQRTQAESADQLWRNTMVTDLYMGGVAGADNMFKILGVDQLIMGSIDTVDNEETLVLTDNTQGGGSAWMAGSLAALSDAFSVSGDVDNPVLELLGANPTLSVSSGADGNVLYADNNRVQIFGNDGIGFRVLGDSKEVTTDFATRVENTLTNTGSAFLASDTGTQFQAGPAGAYISADATNVSLLGGNIRTSNKPDGTADVTEITTPTTNITGATTVGTRSGRNPQIVTNPQLNVQGSTYVRDNLEVGDTIYADKFNTLELHAGGTDFADQNARWLHATRDGVSITNPDSDSQILRANRNETTFLTGPDGYNGGASPAVELGSSNAQLRGVDTADLYTTSDSGDVTLQKGAVVLSGAPGNADGNMVYVNAKETLIDSEFTTVEGTSFNIKGANPSTGGGDLTSDTVFVNTSGDREVAAQTGLFRVSDSTGDTDLLQIRPEGLVGGESASVALDKGVLLLSDVNTLADPNSGSGNQILEVNLDYGTPPDSNADEKSSVYIRRGAIELREVTDNGSGMAADQGYGYIEASRFVSNAKLAITGEVADPTLGYSSDYINNKYYDNSGARVAYDRYMINPAYTSVMHDIKLTTRGGARLSDILPDFINKGIYVVNNTYKDDNSVNLNDINVSIVGGRITVDGANEITPGSTLSGKDKWASPFLGVIPAPQCPPSHARVITITPAGFLMSQAGQIEKEDHYSGKRFVVDETKNVDALGNVLVEDSATVSGAQYRDTTIELGNGASTTIYYLGHATEPMATYGGNPYSPQPLYFQQSTWLKSAVQGVQLDAPHNCNGKGQPTCGDNFVGWAGIMGFAYPGSLYRNIIAKVLNTTTDNVDASAIYWNVFPVRAQTLEAYATVYCYFDRNNMYAGEDGGGQISEEYVDRYDQLNSFRRGYSKPANSYTDRLDDPGLKYKDPW